MAASVPVFGHYVLTDTKRVEADFVGMLDLFDQLPRTVRRIHGTAVLVERGGETINPDLHGQSTSSMTCTGPSGRISPMPIARRRLRNAYLGVAVSKRGSVRK